MMVLTYAVRIGNDRNRNRFAQPVTAFHGRKAADWCIRWSVRGSYAPCFLHRFR